MAMPMLSPSKHGAFTIPLDKCTACRFIAVVAAPHIGELDIATTKFASASVTGMGEAQANNSYFWNGEELLQLKIKQQEKRVRQRERHDLLRSYETQME